jgi:hypothetical protein
MNSISENSPQAQKAKQRHRFGPQTPGPQVDQDYRQLSLYQDLLLELLPNSVVEAFASQTQAQDRRKRKLTCVLFFWLMLLVVAPGGPVSLSGMASLISTAATLAGGSLSQAALSRQALCENLKLRSWTFFEAILNHLLDAYTQLVQPTQRHLDLELVQNVRLIDATVLRVADRLIQVFPGHRTGRKLEWAAVKLHTSFRLFRSIPQVLALTAEKVQEKQVNFLLPKGEKALYLFDLGYWKYRLFESILEQEQHFLSRLQEACNPLILEVYLGNPAWVGQRLKTILLEGAEIDLRVNLTSPYPSNPKMKHDLRLVGQRVETGWHLYITSIFDRVTYPVEILAQLYALRWQIELLFRDLKCVLRIQNLIATNENGVRLQIYAALINYVLTHLMMFKASQQIQVPVEQMSVAKCLVSVAQVLEKSTDLLVKGQEMDWIKLEQAFTQMVSLVYRRPKRKKLTRLAQAIDHFVAESLPVPSFQTLC